MRDDIILLLSEARARRDMAQCIQASGHLAEGESIPAVFQADGRNVTRLAYLNVTHNRLTFLPDDIGNLTHFANVDNLSSLTSLDLRNNQLTCLPAALGDLRQLTLLDLRANKLVALPESMGELTQLQKLDLRWNKLSALPKWLERLEQAGCTIYI